MKKQSGVTLIALVITIIILLLLSGVALLALTGEDNIIKNAQLAVGKYNDETNREKTVLNSIEGNIGLYANGIGTIPVGLGDSTLLFSGDIDVTGTVSYITTSESMKNFRYILVLGKIIKCDGAAVTDFQLESLLIPIDYWTASNICAISFQHTPYYRSGPIIVYHDETQIEYFLGEGTAYNLYIYGIK